jgi:hypothetical protein
MMNPAAVKTRIMTIIMILVKGQRQMGKALLLRRGVEEVVEVN